MEREVERRLTTILAADVAGYSRLMSEDEEGTLARLRQAREIIDRLIARHNGRVFGGAGDSVMAEFPSPVQAVRCAVQIQQELERFNADLPEARRMLFRIGINLGDVMVENGNLFGDGVNIADRLQGLAAAGEICIADGVYQQVRNKVPVGYERLGRYSVRHIAEPVLVYRVLARPEDVRPLRRALARLGGRSRTLALAGVVLLLAGGVAAWLWSGLLQKAPRPEDFAAIPDIAVPTRHFRVENPAELSEADALTIYDRIIDDMVAAYRKSGDPSAGTYYRWRRYNTVPYLSATHGRRYVNNYANARAGAYGLYGRAGTLPAGSILAKDAFEVTENGDVVTGPLTLMEKMEPGFNPEGRDWRYTMILPDGTLFGTTNGPGSGRVEFCQNCHIAAGDEHDHLFFIPKPYRVRFLNPGEGGD
ncbi:MAG: hypothetical protein D6754_11970 [Alphaproteobacteria bacterium]|nr:MAG: hypothetical protein D6754_11970 [Alphaproteobacteria bacterium]